MIKKVFLIFLIILLILSSINLVQAINMKEIIEKTDKFVAEGKTKSGEALDLTQINNSSKSIFNSLLIIGTSVAVIWGIVLGIKFITGSVEEKVKVKESVIPYIVGCVIAFGAFTIWKIVILLLR